MTLEKGDEAVERPRGTIHDAVVVSGKQGDPDRTELDIEKVHGCDPCLRLIPSFHVPGRKGNPRLSPCPWDIPSCRDREAGHPRPASRPGTTVLGDRPRLMNETAAHIPPSGRLAHHHEGILQQAVRAAEDGRDIDREPGAVQDDIASASKMKPLLSLPSLRKRFLRAGAPGQLLRKPLPKVFGRRVKRLNLAEEWRGRARCARSQPDRGGRATKRHAAYGGARGAGDRPAIPPLIRGARLLPAAFCRPPVLLRESCRQ